MKKLPGNLKPSVLAVSAIMGVIFSNYATAEVTTISGTITNSGDLPRYVNGGTISTLINNGNVIAYNIGIQNSDGTIDSLINNGSISGGDKGIHNEAKSYIYSLTNNNYISSNTIGINNENLIGTLANYGTISGGKEGILSSSAIGNIKNFGDILGEDGIHNDRGKIGTLNNSGDIRGQSHAINNRGTIGQIINSGRILGDIYSTSGLTITGGSGTDVGILSGYTDKSFNLTDLLDSISSVDSASSGGAISITSGDLVFSGGNLLLNDNVTLASGSLKNNNSSLYIASPIRIDGNYSQSATASLNHYVFSDSHYGKLEVTGTASIASGSSVNLIGYQYAFASGQRYVVISAADGNYNESSLNYKATGYKGSITGTSVKDGANDTLVLTLSDKPNPIQATTPNAVASLQGLQRYSGTSDAALLNLYNASLAIGSTAESNKAGEQLSPNQNASAGFATSSTTFDMMNVIGQRLSSVDTVRLARVSGGESGISAGDESPQQAGWGQIFGGRAKQNMTDDISGYRANYTGAVVGYDQAISDDWRLGGALSYTYTSVDGTDNVKGSSSHVKSWGLTTYASYAAPAWYSNLYAAVLQQNYSTKRQVSFTGYDGGANGDFDGQQYAFKAEFGYPIALSRNVVLTPLANASYSYLYQEGYTENGGNGAALKVDSAHTDAIKSGLGAKLETTLSTHWGDVVPYAQLMWNHQYNNDRMAITAAYAASVNETSFTSRGSSPVKDAAGLAVGATLLGFGNTSLTANYDLGVAQNYTNQSVSLRFKQSF